MPETPSATTPTTGNDHRWLILVMVSVAQLMVVLDATIVNIALPSAQHDLGFGNDARSWVITAYALSFGSLLLLGGRVGDLLGRKVAFITGLVAFAVASAVGGAAPNFGVLVAARAVQGLAGALLAPSALSTLVTTFHDPRERGKAFGVFGSVAVGGGAVGLILGGVLTQYLSWRWTMYVNVVFAAAAVAGALLYMTNQRPPVRPRIDGLGTVLASAGLFGLVFGFSHAETASWGAPTTVVALIAGAVLLIGFVLVEQRVEVPLLPLRVVTDRSRGVAFLAVAVAGIAVFGVFLFLTYYLQLIKHFSPVACGFAYLPMIACVILSSNVANIVTLPRFGPKIVITIGMSLGCLSLLYLARLDPGSSYAVDILPALLVFGLAMGSVMAPAMNTATVGVRPSDAGVAAALVSTMQQVGGSVGTAVLSTVVASASAGFATGHAGASAVAAATHGYVIAFLIVAVLFGAGALLCGALFPTRAALDARRAAGVEATPEAAMLVIEV